MLVSQLQNQRILLWGLGTEGSSTLRFLQQHKLDSKVIIYNDADIELPAEFAHYPLFTGAQLSQVLPQIDVIIKSPGVSLYRPEVIQAKEQGIAFTSSTDIFMDEVRTHKPECKIIAVSGSKGKSTSTSALYHILHTMGYKVALGGNIGRPLIELIDGDYDYIVAEISSYQASDLHSSPQIAMFTNLFFVHSAWHHSHENYCRDKLHLIAHQQAEDVCFVNARNEELMQYISEYPQHNIQYYDVAEGFHREGKKLLWQDKEVLDITDLQLCGDHNLDNLSGIFSILRYLGIDVAQAAQVLRSFEPLAHRLQNVGTINGVTFINDSISTAPEAAVGAMQSFDGNLAIISGGEENTQNYAEYADFVETHNKVKMVVTLFQCGPKIAEVVRSRVTRPDFVLLEADSLEQAVRAAYNELLKQGGGTVLFSPTSPSFGFYKNFMERGQHFIDIVKQLGYK